MSEGAGPATVEPMPTRLRQAVSVLGTVAAPLGQSTEWARGLVTFVFVTGYFWMQWQSPRDGAVPLGLVSAVGMATGFYLTHPDANRHARTALCIIYVVALVAFYMVHNWAPAEVIAQVTVILGILFGPLTAKRNGNGTGLVVPTR